MRFRVVVTCISTSVAVLLPVSRASAQEICFDAAVNYAVGDYPFSVFAADLDGDGDADLAVANVESDNVSVLKNNGDGTFAAAISYPAGFSSSSVFAADLDGDEDADLAVTVPTSYRISILINCGTAAPCYCPCSGDPQCDSASNPSDVVKVVDVAFRGVHSFTDLGCPHQRTDVNCDGYTTVQDVVKVVNVSFRAADPVTEFCDPCP